MTIQAFRILSNFTFDLPFWSKLSFLLQHFTCFRTNDKLYLNYLLETSYITDYFFFPTTCSSKGGWVWFHILILGLLKKWRFEIATLKCNAKMHIFAFTKLKNTISKVYKMPKNGDLKLPTWFWLQNLCPSGYWK